MSGSFFATLPLATRIRKAAVAVIASQGTIAGLAVQDSPLDPIPDGTSVAVNVFSQERRSTISAAGGRPGFRVDFTLNVQVIYADASEQQAILQSDILRQQVFDALFEDPVWPSMLQAIGSVEEEREKKMDGERYRIQYLISINAGWRENYASRSTSVLAGGGPPGLSAPVVVPLQQVNNTYVAGDAPGPGGEGSVQTTFTSTVPISPS